MGDTFAMHLLRLKVRSTFTSILLVDYITRYYCRLNDTRPTTWSEVTSGSLLARLVSLLGSSINLCNFQMTSLACFIMRNNIDSSIFTHLLIPGPSIQIFHLKLGFRQKFESFNHFFLRKFKNFGSDFFSPTSKPPKPFFSVHIRFSSASGACLIKSVFR